MSDLWVQERNFLPLPQQPHLANIIHNPKPTKNENQNTSKSSFSLKVHGCSKENENVSKRGRGKVISPMHSLQSLKGE